MIRRALSWSLLALAALEGTAGLIKGNPLLGLLGLSNLTACS